MTDVMRSIRRRGMSEGSGAVIQWTRRVLKAIWNLEDATASSMAYLKSASDPAVRDVNTKKANREGIVHNMAGHSSFQM
jgi:hypothetical protein